MPEFPDNPFPHWWLTQKYSEGDFLRRYLDGDCKAVWEDMIWLGYAIRTKPCFDDAVAVAEETMRRVRTNVERVATALEGFGFEFEDELMGASNLQILDAVEERFGCLPISLRAFWKVVGAIDLKQAKAKDKDLDYQMTLCAPIDVYNSASTLSELHHHSAGGRLHTCYMFSDTAGSGNDYGVLLPDPTADATLERNPESCFGSTFVDHLRQAFVRGGFLTPEGSYSSTNSSTQEMCTTIAKSLEPI